MPENLYLMSALSSATPQNLTQSQLNVLGSHGVTGGVSQEQQLVKLSERNKLYRRVVYMVLERAAAIRWKITGLPKKVAPEVVENLLRDWALVFGSVQALADITGKAKHIIINTYGERGQQTRASKLAPGSVATIVLTPSAKALTRDGDYYIWRDELFQIHRVHHTRVIELQPRDGGSLISRFHAAYELYRASLTASIETMVQRDTIVLTKRGLEDDIEAQEDPEEYILATLKPMLAAKREHGVLLVDGRFEVNMISHNLSQLSDVIDRAKEHMVASSGLSERQLMGKTPEGPVNEDPDAAALGKDVDTLVQHRWLPFYRHLLALLRGNPGVAIEPMPSFELSATALSQIALEHMRATTIAISDGVLLPREVRHGWAGGVFTQSVELDPSYTPPDIPVSRQAVKNNDLSRVPPNERDHTDPKNGDKDTPSAPTERPRRASDAELKEAIASFGFGKSQPRVATLRKIEDRAIDDADCPANRLLDFCLAWLKPAEYETIDEDLLPASRRA